MKTIQKSVSIQMLLFILLDAVLVIMAGGLALLVRFDFDFEQVPAGYLEPWFRALPIQILVTTVVFWLRRMYRYLWRYVSVHDVAEMAVSVFLAYAVFHVPALLFGYRQPRSVLFMELLFQLFLLVGERCSIRFLRMFANSARQARQEGGERVMLIGAGEAGRMLLREISVTQQLQSRVCCIIDDDPGKQGKYVGNVPIVGGREKIPEAVKKKRITQIILPAASARDKKEILNICQKTGCRVRSLPGIYQLVNGEVSMAAVKDVQIEDLLGREPVKLDTAVLRNFLQGQTVLVTGGGGSIGSELCRQIAKYQPKQLIILDIYENNAYDIQQELRRVWGDRLNLRVEIASVRDKEKVYSLFQAYRPDIVLHAAAHKHVPLMEECPEEAIKNNIFGTYNVACMAGEYGVETFVLISSDKAVNPTNVMGASKRMCEMIVQSLNDRYDTKYVAVRFGNVLGSNGSIIPLFRQQIAQGGPVTVTDKRVIRYFMTIPEAVSLVMLAGSDARGGEIFILDMGEPVKIDDLARNMIRLSGLEPGVDIEIVYTGLRPGEKLYEELLIKEEGLRSTDNKLIFIGKPLNICPEDLQKPLEVLWKACMHNSPDIKTLLEQAVPTYHITDNRPA